MYRSAYFKLLSGPAEVLRRLDPPVELADIVGGVTSAAAAMTPDVLLRILKALTKDQASQVAAMYDREARHAKGLADINTAVRSMSTPVSQPPSGEVSPTGSCASATEHATASGSGAATPTKRKYNKTGKYSMKKRPAWSLAPPAAPLQASAPATPLERAPRPPPAMTKHEAEINRRFQDALAMDHRTVQNPDWRTPFSGPRDLVQRLLPYHVFQHHDRDIDAGIDREDRRAQASARSLGDRAAMLRQRYAALTARQGSASHYHVDEIQLDRLRLAAARAELDGLRDLQLQRNISLMGARYLSGL